jgi:hypothetical protein
MVAMCTAYAVLGVGTFLSLEGPLEELRYAAKQKAARVGRASFRGTLAFQAIEVDTQFIADHWWMLMRTENMDRQLNETAFHERVRGTQ